MKEVIKREELVALFTSVSNEMNAHKDKLEELDSLLGDGDLGLTMTKGFAVIPEVIKTLDDEKDIGKVLMKAGMKMSSEVPSTMGFLMSTGIMTAGKKLKGKEEINAEGLVAFFEGFKDGVIKRGKCQLQERTLLDVMEPAYHSAASIYEKNPEISLEELITKVDLHCEGALNETKWMVPVHGKAAIHKEACKGVIDQGAYAGYLLIEGLYHYVIS